jgi:hypothetical protein
MACRTSKGYVNKELTGDGRESLNRQIDRELGIRKPTKTKLKRRKKADRALMDSINNF